MHVLDLLSLNVYAETQGREESHFMASGSIHSRRPAGVFVGKIGTIH